MQPLNKTRKFLFKCDKCGKIIEVEFDEKKDIEKVQGLEVEAECDCGGICDVLLD